MHYGLESRTTIRMSFKYHFLLSIIKDQIKELGTTERQVCLDAGIGVDSVRTIRRNSAPKGTTLKALGKTLNIAPQVLFDAANLDDWLSRFVENIEPTPDQLLRLSEFIDKDDLKQLLTPEELETHVFGSNSREAFRAMLDGRTIDVPTEFQDSIETRSSDDAVYVSDSSWSVPEIDVRGGAGGGGTMETQLVTTDEYGNNFSTDDVKDLWGIPDYYLNEELRLRRQAARIVEVRGDSMSPTLESGDRVMVDTSDLNPSPPGIFAVWDGFGLVIKRVELLHMSDPPTIRISSDNARHEPFERTIDEIKIVGRIVWRATRL